MRNTFFIINKLAGLAFHDFIYYTTINLYRLLLLLLLLLLLITRPLPRDGGMTEDHEAPEARKLPKVWTRGCWETECRQRVSGVESP